MFDNTPEQDELADTLFGETYFRLSSWGKHRVDQELRRPEAKVDAPYNQGLDNTTAPALAEFDRLARANESLAIENHELFEENGELRRQLAEIQGQA